MYVCIYIYIYMHTYIHTHIHTYIHTYDTYIHAYIHTCIYTYFKSSRPSPMGEVLQTMRQGLLLAKLGHTVVLCHALLGEARPYRRATVPRGLGIAEILTSSPLCL